MMGHMMSLEQAVCYYLGIHNPPSGDLRADLILAAEVAAKWRREGPEATATILHALNDHFGMSHVAIAAQTGIPSSTIGNLIRRLNDGYWEN